MNKNMPWPPLLNLWQWKTVVRSLQEDGLDKNSYCGKIGTFSSHKEVDRAKISRDSILFLKKITFCEHNVSLVGPCLAKVEEVNFKRITFQRILNIIKNYFWL